MCLIMIMCPVSCSHFQSVLLMCAVSRPAWHHRLHLDPYMRLLCCHKYNNGTVSPCRFKKHASCHCRVPWTPEHPPSASSCWKRRNRQLLERLPRKQRKRGRRPRSRRARLSKIPSSSSSIRSSSNRSRRTCLQHKKRMVVHPVLHCHSPLPTVVTAHNSTLSHRGCCSCCLNEACQAFREKYHISKLMMS